jgi:hypothetical protein
MVASLRGTALGGGQLVPLPTEVIPSVPGPPFFALALRVLSETWRDNRWVMPFLQIFWNRHFVQLDNVMVQGFLLLTTLAANDEISLLPAFFQEQICLVRLQFIGRHPVLFAQALSSLARPYAISGPHLLAVGLVVSALPRSQSLGVLLAIGTFSR